MLQTLSPRSAAELILRAKRLRELGDVEGHAFHGNQWQQAREIDPNGVTVVRLANLKAEIRRRMADPDSELNQAKEQVKDRGEATVYHGTSDKMLKAIQQNGLVPKGGKGADAWLKDEMPERLEPVRLLDTLIEGRQASVFTTTQERNADLFAQYASDVNRSKPVVLEINIPKDDVFKHLKLDELSHGMRFEGKIPPEWIRVSSVGQTLYDVPIKEYTGSSNQAQGHKFLEAAADDEFLTFYMVLQTDESEEPRVAGEGEGHDFHGNQWTDNAVRQQAEGLIDKFGKDNLESYKSPSSSPTTGLFYGDVDRFEKIYTDAGFSKDAVETAMGLLHGHGGWQGIQQASDKEMLDHLAKGDEVGKVLQLHSELEEGIFDRWRSTKPEPYPEWMTHPDFGYENKPRQQDLELYRHGAVGKHDIESWTTNPEGAQPQAATNPDLHWTPNVSMKLSELHDKGWQVLAGFGYLMGSPGDSEITLIRKSALYPKRLKTAGEAEGHAFHGNQWTDNAWRSDPYAHVPTRLYRGTETGSFEKTARSVEHGELGGGIYFTGDYELARTYGGGPTASFEGGTRAVHTVEFTRTPEPHEVAYMEGLGKDGETSRLIDGNGKELWRGEWPGKFDNEASKERDAMFKAAKDHNIKVMVGLQNSLAANQVSVLDRSILKHVQTLALPKNDVPNYEHDKFVPHYRVKSQVKGNYPPSPTSRFLGDKEGHAFHGNQWTPNAKNDVEPRFDFASQVGQYPPKGDPGIGYFKGELDKNRYVNALLYRDEQGQVRGILNHYPQDITTRAGGIYGGMQLLLERKGNVNLMVDPTARRQGIATKLYREADRRWKINPKQQEYTTEGRKFYESLVKKAKSRHAGDVEGHDFHGNQYTTKSVQGARAEKAWHQEREKLRKAGYKSFGMQSSPLILHMGGVTHVEEFGHRNGSTAKASFYVGGTSARDNSFSLTVTPPVKGASNTFESRRDETLSHLPRGTKVHILDNGQPLERGYYDHRPIVGRVVSMDKHGTVHVRHIEGGVSTKVRDYWYDRTKLRKATTLKGAEDDGHPFHGNQYTGGLSNYKERLDEYHSKGQKRVLEEFKRQDQQAAAQHNPLAHPVAVIGLPDMVPQPLAERYVAAYGEEFKSQDKPKDVDQGPANECYRNASLVVLENPDLSYAEGFATKGTSGLSVLHAWAVDKAGNVVDNTIPDAHEWKYFGVKYDRSKYLQYLYKAKKYGVLGSTDKNALNAIKTGGRKLR